MSSESKSYSDNELVALFQEGRAEYAFNMIVLKYQERLYWHIRKIVISHDDADDVVQNTLLKAWKGLELFRSDAQLYTWLYRIATNEALTFLNSKKKRIFIPIFSEEHDLSQVLESDPYFQGDEAEKKFQKVLLKLPEKQRLVFNMKYFDDMKYEDIAEVLNTSVGALKASYHHAVKKIEKYLTHD
ncbi:MAG: RNA polymerase sigma factor [Bacteroidales bacterium]|nr:RNA polymerase sigma factor [Bacteroidales bacterium]MBN2818505.1 RNA polymerase sigma factor [Bacteroidales bacterium]